MRFGCCVTSDLIDIAADAGYDYVEAPVATLLPEMPDESFRGAQARLAGSPLPLEVWNELLPQDLKVCGPSVDWPRAARYVNTAVRRAASAGGSVLVFACGPARSIPPDFDVEDALGQLTDFLRVCCAVGRGRGVIVGVEALSAACTNLINSIPEAMELARSVAAPEVGVLPSCHHMGSQCQSALDVVDAAEWLAHAHISVHDLAAAEEGRSFPGEFVQALKRADYDGRVSVEGPWTEPVRQLPQSLAALRHLCNDP